MDQSYFRFLFRLARKSKQSGLSKSEKSLAKRNVTLKPMGCHYRQNSAIVTFVNGASNFVYGAFVFINGAFVFVNGAFNFVNGAPIFFIIFF